MNNHETLYNTALDLLKQLIAQPSFSREEAATAGIIEQWLTSKGIPSRRHVNNVFAYNLHYDTGKPTILLNSHHDTVRPAAGYTRNPFEAVIENRKLYGLGSNDAGGPLVSLLAAFVYFYRQEALPFNLVLAATAEEEISGVNGISAILELLGPVEAAIVGEPTRMQMAVAERGLLVVDALATGVSGHAARKEGVNALYTALNDITRIQDLTFENESAFLGKTTMQVTTIETANKAHNMVPDSCSFTIDIRLNENDTHESVLATLRQSLASEITPRSTRLRSSMIPLSHPLVRAGAALGLEAYGSPTLSDKALMPFPALKTGPGDSARSHTADEYICLDEIREGIRVYIDLLSGVQWDTSFNF